MSTKRIIIATILSLIILIIGIGIGIGIARTGKITIARLNHNANGQVSAAELRHLTADLKTFSHRRDLKELVTAQHLFLAVDAHNVL